MSNQPPTPRLHLNLSINANSVDDLAAKLLDLSSEIALREEGEWNVSSSRGWSYYSLFNAEMTPERYAAELREWWQERKAARAAARA